ncbi:MAG TPA: NUDIX hydrolase [Candidatus Moranbacteria bacterium]|nr:NUDIX hydrolase [Candidatus Moranbacteria bacterium]
MKVQNTRNKDNNVIIGPAVAVDALIFTIRDGDLMVLLIKIGSGPYKNKWALPGGIVQIDETLDDTAKRVLKEKAGVRGIYMEQLYAFSELKRDIRWRMISVAYFALVNSDKINLKTMDYYSDIDWIKVSKLPKMAFDHKKIIKYGLKRLRAKIEYTNIVYGLLGDEFTLTELQNVYEIILNQKIDKRNFRKKILSMNLLEETKKIKRGLKHRPAKLYRFKDRKLIFTK